MPQHSDLGVGILLVTCGAQKLHAQPFGRDVTLLWPDHVSARAQFLASGMLLIAKSFGPDRIFANDSGRGDRAGVGVRALLPGGVAQDLGLRWLRLRGAPKWILSVSLPFFDHGVNFALHLEQIEKPVVSLPTACVSAIDTNLDASEMDVSSVGPSGVHQDAIHHQQIHRKRDHVAYINGGLSIEQSVHQPK